MEKRVWGRPMQGEARSQARRIQGRGEVRIIYHFDNLLSLQKCGFAGLAGACDQYGRKLLDGQAKRFLKLSLNVHAYDQNKLLS
jgi:hypothetical protein